MTGFYFRIERKKLQKKLKALNDSLDKNPNDDLKMEKDKIIDFLNYIKVSYLFLVFSKRQKIYIYF